MEMGCPLLALLSELPKGGWCSLEARWQAPKWEWGGGGDVAEDGQRASLPGRGGLSEVGPEVDGAAAAPPVCVL